MHVGQSDLRRHEVSVSSNQRLAFGQQGTTHTGTHAPRRKDINGVVGRVFIPPDTPLKGMEV